MGTVANGRSGWGGVHEVGDGVKGFQEAFLFRLNSSSLRLPRSPGTVRATFPGPRLTGTVRAADRTFLADALDPTMRFGTPPRRARPVTQAGSGQTDRRVFPAATADPGTKAAPANGKTHAGFAQVYPERSKLQRFTIDKTHKISIGSPGIPTISDPSTRDILRDGGGQIRSNPSNSTNRARLISLQKKH